MIAKYLPWLLSAITIYMTLLAGNQHRSAWLVGIVNQGLWLFWITVTGSWGFLPMNAALWAIYARNHLKWNHPAPGKGAAMAATDQPLPPSQRSLRTDTVDKLVCDSTPAEFVAWMVKYHGLPQSSAWTVESNLKDQFHWHRLRGRIDRSQAVSALLELLVLFKRIGMRKEL